MLKQILYILTLLLITSCGVQHLTATEYLDYCVEHESEFTSSGSYSNVSGKLIWYPADRFLAQAQVDGTDIGELKSVKKEISKKVNTSFALNLSFNTGNLLTQTNASSTEQMRFYAVDFKNNIKAVTSSSDTISCTNYVFESNGNIGGRAHFDFDFPANITTLQKVILYSPYLKDSVMEFTTTGYTTKHPELKIK